MALIMWFFVQTVRCSSTGAQNLWIISNHTGEQNDLDCGFHAALVVKAEGEGYFSVKPLCTKYNFSSRSDILIHWDENESFMCSSGKQQAIFMLRNCFTDWKKWIKWWHLNGNHKKLESRKAINVCQCGHDCLIRKQNVISDIPRPDLVQYGIILRYSNMQV